MHNKSRFTPRQRIFSLSAAVLTLLTSQMACGTPNTAAPNGQMAGPSTGDRLDHYMRYERCGDNRQPVNNEWFSDCEWIGGVDQQVADAEVEVSDNTGSTAVVTNTSSASSFSAGTSNTGDWSDPEPEDPNWPAAGTPLSSITDEDFWENYSQGKAINCLNRRTGGKYHTLVFGEGGKPSGCNSEDEAYLEEPITLADLFVGGNPSTGNEGSDSVAAAAAAAVTTDLVVRNPGAPNYASPYIRTVGNAKLYGQWDIIDEMTEGDLIKLCHDGNLVDDGNQKSVITSLLSDSNNYYLYGGILDQLFADGLKTTDLTLHHEPNSFDVTLVSEKAHRDNSTDLHEPIYDGGPRSGGSKLLEEFCDPDNQCVEYPPQDGRYTYAVAGPSFHDDKCKPDGLRDIIRNRVAAAKEAEQAEAAAQTQQQSIVELPSHEPSEITMDMMGKISQNPSMSNLWSYPAGRIAYLVDPTSAPRGMQQTDQSDLDEMVRQMATTSNQDVAVFKIDSRTQNILTLTLVGVVLVGAAASGPPGWGFATVAGAYLIIDTQKLTDSVYDKSLWSCNSAAEEAYLPGHSVCQEQ